MVINITNYTLPTNANQSITGMYTFMRWIQEPGVSGGVFIPWVLFGVYVIALLLLKGYQNSKAFSGASFMFMILAIIFRVLGFLSNKWMYFSIILVGLGAVWMHVDNSAN